jgi:hypothetical protein
MHSPMFGQFPQEAIELAKPGCVQQRPFDLAGEVVVAGVAHHPARQDVLDVV